MTGAHHIIPAQTNNQPAKQKKAQTKLQTTSDQPTHFIPLHPQYSAQFAKFSASSLRVSCLRSRTPPLRLFCLMLFVNFRSLCLSLQWRSEARVIKVDIL